MFKRWLDETKYCNHLMDSLPLGTLFSKSRNDKTNMHKLVVSLCSSLVRYVIGFNQTFKSIFIEQCSSDTVLSYWKESYNLPNINFLDTETPRRDVYCHKFLMNGNTLWNYKAIANLYDMNIRLTATKPGEINIDFSGGASNVPSYVPFYLGADSTLLKIKYIYNQIKEAHINITYNDSFEETEEEKANRVQFPNFEKE